MIKLCRAFIEIEKDKFVPVGRILNNPDFRKLVVKKAKGELESWGQSYGAFEELQPIISVIESQSEENNGGR